MNSDTIKTMRELGSLSKREAETLVGSNNIIEGFFVCKTCGKQVPISQMRTINSKIKENILDPICDECREEFKRMKTITIACLGCNEVIARMEPKKYKTGFETKAGEIYHIADCPKCNPERFKDPSKPTPSKLIEEQVYNQKFSKK